jgi:hypothetical protein
MRKESAKDRAQRPAALPPRGKLKFSSEDHPLVAPLREWMVGNGLPSSCVKGVFPIERMTAAYNDTSGKELDALRRDADAVEYARRSFSLDVTSWTKQGGLKVLGTGPTRRKDELRHAIQGLKTVLDNLADLVPFIHAARTYWLPAVERALQAKEERGRSAGSFVPHRRLIQQTVNAVCQRYGYRLSRSPATKAKGNRESACSIVAKALKLNGIKPKREEVVQRICSPRKQSRNRTSDQSQS